jgi:hypothetical protein
MGLLNRINRTWGTKVKFVPIFTDIDDPMFCQEVVIDSGLEEDSIDSVRLMKNPACRDPNQQVAHLIVKFTSQEAANQAILRTTSQYPEINNIYSLPLMTSRSRLTC